MLPETKELLDKQNKKETNKTNIKYSKHVNII